MSERKEHMKLFTCTDHEGMYPVPTASLVIADSKLEAYDLMYKELHKRNLHNVGFTLQEVDIKVKKAIILSDGDY